jgi:hypothetical protein
MPIISNRTTVPASSTVENLIAGSPWEFLPFDAHVEIALTMDSGETIGDLLADVYSGSDILGTGVAVPNNGPISTDRDIYFEDDALAGERLVLKVRNTTATATGVNFFVRITAI